MALTKESVEKMNVKELQKELQTLGQDTKGKKAELLARLLPFVEKQTESTEKSSETTSTTTSPTLTSTSTDNATIPTTATTTTTNNHTNDNDNSTNDMDVDIDKMTVEERRLHRANKFKSKDSNQPETETEKKMNRMLKFGTTGSSSSTSSSITSPPPLPQSPKSSKKNNNTTPTKVPLTKIHKQPKESLSSQTEISARQKKFGTTGSSDSDAIAQRAKKFGTKIDV
eukprot:gene9030-11062_t